MDQGFFTRTIVSDEAGEKVKDEPNTFLMSQGPAGSKDLEEAAGTIFDWS